MRHITVLSSILLRSSRTASLRVFFAVFTLLSVVILQPVNARSSSKPEPLQSTPRFFTLSTKIGLAQDTVVDMLLDSDGFLYLGTEGGFNRWDGYTLQRVHGSSGELTDASIIALYQDSRGTIWISTASSGIYSLDTTTGEITRRLYLPYKNDPNYYQSAANFFEDSKGRILISMEQSLYRFSYETGNALPIAELPEALLADYHAMRWVIEHDNLIIIASSNGLFTLKENGLLTEIEFLPASRRDNIDARNTKHLLVDSNQRLWISSVLGLYAISAGDFVAASKRGQTEIATSTVIPNRNIWRVKEFASEQFWIGTDIGLYQLDARDGFNFTYLFEPRKGVDVLSRKDFLDIEIDRDGNLWLATNFGGALYWSPKSLQFDTLQITDKQNVPKALTDNTVWSILQDTQGIVWIGTDNGLTGFDAETGQSTLYFEQEKFVPFDVSYIDRIFEYDDDTLILQSGLGLWRFDKTTGERERFTAQSQMHTDILSDYIVGSAQDAQKRIWFNFYSQFYVYDASTGVLSEANIQDGINPSKFYTFFNADPNYNNAMWMSTIGELSLVSPDSFERKSVHKLSAKYQHKEFYPSSVVLDEKGVLWVGYPGHGLYGLNGETFEQLYFFSQDNALSTNLVYSLMLDDNQNLWFSSHSGLHRLSSERDTIDDFRYGQELNVAEFNDSAFAHLDDGRLAFGSPSGVVLFNPSKLELESIPENQIQGQTASRDKMSISEVSLSTRELSLPNHNIDGQNITLNHDDNGLSIRFSSLQFSQVSNTSYQYRLEKNGQVITTSTTKEPFVNFPLLEAGDYRFYVEPLNIAMDMEPASLGIKVLEPPWLTTRAKLLYFVLTVTLISAIYTVRKAQRYHLEQARNQVRLFGNAFQQTRDWVLIFDTAFKPIASNPTFEQAFALDPELPTESKFAQLQRDYPELYHNTLATLQKVSEQGFLRTEQKLKLADGKEHDVLINFNAVKNAENDALVDHYLIVFSDISDQKEAERKLMHMATFDGLTGLVNRNLLLDRLEHAIENAKRHETLVAVLFVDLDRFKGINDSLGHDYGDNILRVVAKRMQNIVHDNDTVGRIGGDEFVIVMEDIGDFEEVSSFIANLIALIEEPIKVKSEVLRVSCSIGVSIYPNDGTEPTDLLRYADTAMYSAKSDSVNSFKFFTESMNVRAKYRLSLENLVKRAYQQKQFYNVYQPIVNVQTGKTEGMELLMRSTISEQPVSPAEFIPILEEMRLIVEVTRWSIEAGIRDLAIWYKRGYSGYLSVNLSALHFSSHFDLAFIENALEIFNLPNSALRFEVTESVLMGDKDTALAQFNAIKQAGYKLALDDFGTGYSSLSYLKMFPLDVIKIDKSFTDDIGDGESGDSLIVTTIGMAKNLQMACVAEGIETYEQAKFLATNYCFNQQGYFFSKPISAEQAVDIVLTDWRTYLEASQHN